jgi:hypothetical protein
MFSKPSVHGKLETATHEVVKVPTADHELTSEVLHKALTK